MGLMRRVWFAPLFTILLTAVAAGSATAAAPRVAVIAQGEASSDAVKVGALLDAAILAQDDRVEVVDRERLKAVLAEQQLAALAEASGVADRVKLGQLLDADLLLMVSVGKGQTVKLVASETDLGLRLHADALPTKDANALLRESRAFVDRMLQIHATPIREIVAVPPFKSEDISFKHDERRWAYAELAGAAARLLPGVVTVELEEAEAIGRELTIGGRKNFDRPLPLYLQGTYESTRDQSVEIELVLQRGSKQVDRRTLPAAEPAKAAADLRQAVIDLLSERGQASPTPPDPKAEAAALRTRAAEARKLGYYEDAVRLSQSALLLSPDDNAVRQIMLQSFAEWIGPEVGAGVNTHIEKLDADWQARLDFMVPHAERYMIENKLVCNYDQQVWLCFPYLTLTKPEVSSEIILRVMKHKVKHSPSDPMNNFLERLFTASFGHKENGSDLMLDTLVRASQYWPELKRRGAGGDYSLRMYLNLFFHNSGKDVARQRDALNRMVKLEGGIAMQAAEVMLANLADGKNVAGYPELDRREREPEPEMAGKTRAEIVRLPLPVLYLDGWLTTIDGIDVGWGRTRNADRDQSLLFMVGPDRKAYKLADIVGSGSDAVCFDGRYVWAFASSKDSASLIAIDIKTRKRVEITPDDGLPDSPVFMPGFASTEPGKVLVAATIGNFEVKRTWIGWAAVDGLNKGKVEVLLSARDNKGNGVESAFLVRQVWGFNGAGPQGGDRFIIERDSDWLVFDPGEQPVFRKHRKPTRMFDRVVTTDNVMRWVTPDGGKGRDLAAMRELDPKTLQHRIIRNAVHQDSVAILGDRIYSVTFGKGVMVGEMGDADTPLELLKTELNEAEFPFHHGRFTLSQHYGLVWISGTHGAYQILVEGQPVSLAPPVIRGTK